ncbi:MAG: magnesium chelatase domain-containing protein [Spirochaetota bacterium]
MIYSYAAAGFSGQLIQVECSIRRGMPHTDIVGLPDGAVKEARERVRAVLHHCEFLYPSDRILINLAPAGLKKSGAGFDLPIALAILLQSQQLPAGLEELPELLVLGELELSGKVRGIAGALAAVASSHEMGIEHFLVPESNLKEIESLELRHIFTLGHISELPQKIEGIMQETLRQTGPSLRVPTPQNATENQMCEYQDEYLDFADIKGQPLLKRAVEIAIAGRHNMLIFGPPGCGKTMIVRSVPSLFPRLSGNESVETTRIWSQAGLLRDQQTSLQFPPVRMPHHSATLEGLVGGGPQLNPGEVSLSHNGL